MEGGTHTHTHTYGDSICLSFLMKEGEQDKNNRVNDNLIHLHLLFLEKQLERKQILNSVIIS